MGWVAVIQPYPALGEGRLQSSWLKGAGSKPLLKRA